MANLLKFPEGTTFRIIEFDEMGFEHVLPAVHHIHMRAEWVDEQNRRTSYSLPLGLCPGCVLIREKYIHSQVEAIEVVAKHIVRDLLNHEFLDDLEKYRPVVNEKVT